VGPGLEARPPRSRYRMLSRQKPDGTVAGSSKRLASRFYQLKTGRYLSGQCLQWTNRSVLVCRYRTQTWDRLFKACPQWKAQQKILWAELRKESRRGKHRFTTRDLPADGKCSQAVPDFLSTMDVGRLVPAEKDAGSVASD